MGVIRIGEGAGCWKTSQELIPAVCSGITEESTALGVFSESWLGTRCPLG